MKKLIFLSALFGLLVGLATDVPIAVFTAALALDGRSSALSVFMLALLWVVPAVSTTVFLLRGTKAAKAESSGSQASVKNWKRMFMLLSLPFLFFLLIYVVGIIEALSLK